MNGMVGGRAPVPHVGPGSGAADRHVSLSLGYFIGLCSGLERRRSNTAGESLRIICEGTMDLAGTFLLHRTEGRVAHRASCCAKGKIPPTALIDELLLAGTHHVIPVLVRSSGKSGRTELSK